MPWLLAFSEAEPAFSGGVVVPPKECEDMMMRWREDVKQWCLSQQLHVDHRAADP